MPGATYVSTIQVVSSVGANCSGTADQTLYTVPSDSYLVFVAISYVRAGTLELGFAGQRMWNFSAAGQTTSILYAGPGTTISYLPNGFNSQINIAGTLFSNS